MPTCEISGKEVDELTTRIIGGAELQVCEDYSHLGEPLEEEDMPEEDEPDGESEVNVPPQMVSDFDERVHDARKKSGLAVDELADRLNIDSEHLHDIEEGEEYPHSTARVQLEQFLNITLLEVPETTEPQETERNFE